MLNLILLGDPAAGKATQAARVSKKYKMFDFDMGRELRKDAKLKAVLKDTHDKGKLTPTAVVRRIDTDKVNSTPKTKGILFDGHPKMVGEAKLIKKLLDKNKRTADTVLVLYLKIPHDEVVKKDVGS